MVGYPYNFQNFPAGTFPASDWDTMWTQAGLAGNIFCTCGGTGNAITLATISTSPTRSPLTVLQHGTVFWFTAAGNSSSGATIAVDSAGAKKAYGQSAIQQLDVGIVANTLYAAIYDSTLDAGNGGFRVISVQLSKVFDAVGYLSAPANYGVQWGGYGRNSATQGAVTLGFWGSDNAHPVDLGSGVEASVNYYGSNFKGYHGNAYFGVENIVTLSAGMDGTPCGGKFVAITTGTWTFTSGSGPVGIQSYGFTNGGGFCYGSNPTAQADLVPAFQLVGEEVDTINNVNGTEEKVGIQIIDSGAGTVTNYNHAIYLVNGPVGYGWDVGIQMGGGHAGGGILGTFPIRTTGTVMRVQGSSGAGNPTVSIGVDMRNVVITDYLLTGDGRIQPRGKASDTSSVIEMTPFSGGGSNYFYVDNTNTYNFLTAGGTNHVINLNGMNLSINQAVPAGGTVGVGLQFSSKTNFGVFYGSGVPTLTAATGSWYMRTDGASTTTRMYINTTGGAVWTAVTTTG